MSAPAVEITKWQLEKQSIGSKTKIKDLPKDIQAFFSQAKFKLGAGINVPNADGVTPLLHALNHNILAANLLLNCSDIDVDYVIPNTAKVFHKPGQSAIYLAAWGFPKEQCFIKILERSANCIKNKPTSGMHANSPILHTVAVLGTPGRIIKLLECGCNIDERAYAEETPLHIAAINCNIPCVITLIQNGARNLTDSKGGTALTKVLATRGSIASDQRWNKLISILHDYERAFKLAETDDVKTMQELFQKSMSGAHYRQRNAEGETLLMIAKRSGKTNMVNFLSAYEVEKAPSVHELASRLTQVELKSSAAAASRHDAGDSKEVAESKAIFPPQAPVASSAAGGSSSSPVQVSSSSDRAEGSKDSSKARP